MKGRIWRSKKFIIITVLAVIVVVTATFGGIALAQAGGSGTTSSSKTSGNPLLARVAAILGIDQQKLENAFAQARSEAREQALDNYLKKLVAQGKITQQQADQYKAWWNSRPNLPVGPGIRGYGGLRGHGGFYGGSISRVTPNK